jgi:hypothetical protein
LLCNRPLLFKLPCSRSVANPDCVAIFPGNHCGSRDPGYICFTKIDFLFIYFIYGLFNDSHIASKT